MSEPFLVKDCTLAVLSTGDSAGSLSEMKEVLARVPASSLYFHFWGKRFFTSFKHPELPNDFARWVYLQLHDRVLAERLGIIDPTDFSDLEGLRRSLIETIEQRLDEVEVFSWTPREQRYHFLRSVIVVFDTERSAAHPSELKTLLPQLSTNSIFYHFIDARRRTPNGTDDFSFWLAQQGDTYGELLSRIQHIDPYFLSLAEQRRKLTEALEAHFS